MKKLGVIGGIGPMASAYFIEQITRMTKANSDQEHIEIMLHSCPQIPDRTEYILGKSSLSPLPMLKKIGLGLENNGADVIAIPCVTAEYFNDELNNEIKVPIIDTIVETASYLKERGIKKAGLMATDGSLKCGLFQAKLREMGIECMCPDSEDQKNVMSIIYEEVKYGREIDIHKFNNIVDNLKGKGCEVVILGCTELSVVKRDFAMPANIIDVIDVISRKAVLMCGKLKEEYEEIITG